MTISIENYIKNKKFVSLYDDAGDLDSCAVGLLCRLTDTELLLMQVDENGWYDGYLSVLLENVHRLDAGGKYEHKLQNLYSLIVQNKSTDSVSLSNIELKVSGINIGILEWSLTKDKLLKISIDQTNESIGLIGKVVKIFEETVQCQMIDQYGKPDGVAEFYLSNIQKIYFDSIELRSIELLICKKVQ